MKTALLSSLLLMATLAADAQSTNLDFENWTSATYPAPEGWYTNNLHFPVTSVLVLQTVGSSSIGIKLLSENMFSPDPGSVMNTRRDPNLGKGGSELPAGLGIAASIKGMYRCDLAPGDSAKVYVVLKKSGTVITRDSFFIKGTQATYTAFSFPLSTATVAADSIVFAAYGGSSGWTGASRTGNYLELDELKLTGSTGTVAVPHGDFDGWLTTTEEAPDNWFATGDVVKTNDKYFGNYAVRLTTTLVDGELERASIFSMEIPIGPAYTDTLEGYYKFTPADPADYGQISAAMWDGDPATQPQGITSSFMPASTYTYFSIPLVNTIFASSLFLNVFSSSGTFAAEGSTLQLDRLSIKKGKKITGVENINSAGSIIAYPNPVRDVLQLSLGSAAPAVVTITNIAGAVMQTTTLTGQQQLTIPLHNWQPGLYLYEVAQGGSVSRGKIIKE